MNGLPEEQKREKIERTYLVEEHLRKYKLMFSEAIWRQRKYKTIPEILDETDIPRFHFNNVTNPDKMKPGSEYGPDDAEDENGSRRRGRPYSLPVDWIERVALAFHDYSWSWQGTADASV